MGSDRKLVLLALDGSDQSLEMVRYISRVLTLSNTEVVLYHVFQKVLPIFWDREQDPVAAKHLEYMEGWSAHKEEKVREFMMQARDLLVSAGIPEESVTISVQHRKQGIARDILEESRFGYDVVALGRRGLGTTDDTMLGSVASKVLLHVSGPAVCLVGGTPKPGKVLVGLDNSWGAMRAANFVAKLLNKGEPQITLAHVVRFPAMEEGEGLNGSYIEKLQQDAEDAIKPVFEKVTKSLLGLGVPASKIGTKVITGVVSRSTALLNEARNGRYGTIVIGRRGVSDVEEFEMGRVAAKLTQVARDMAVWVVS
ncbi:MAG TPA: universal stress protein [Syntrophobacteraceae bacterium]|nr:universal stress protein [Syntrophobacteraceae bacterium]